MKGADGGGRALLTGFRRFAAASLIALPAFGVLGWQTARAETATITCPLNRFNDEQYLQFVLDMSRSLVVHAFNFGGPMVAPFGDVEVEAPFVMTARTISWDLFEEHWVFDRVTYRVNNTWAGTCQVEMRPL